MFGGIDQVVVTAKGLEVETMRAAIGFQGAFWPEMVVVTCDGQVFTEIEQVPFELPELFLHQSEATFQGWLRAGAEGQADNMIHILRNENVFTVVGDRPRLPITQFIELRWKGE